MAETKKGIGEQMKQHKTMITLLVVLVVCVGLYFLMGAIADKQEEKELKEDILVTNLADLVSLEYTDGKKTLSFAKEDDAWYVADDKNFALDSSKVETMENVLVDVMAERELEGADELSAYGLKEPAYTIAMKDANGKETTLYIGNASGDHYYATVDEKKAIYTIGSSVPDVLEFDLTAMEVEEDEASK